MIAIFNSLILIDIKQYIYNSKVTSKIWLFPGFD